jgi:hypothetical protein
MYRSRYVSSFGKSQKPSNRRDRALASNPDIPLEYLRFLAGLRGIKLSQKLYFGAIHSRRPNDTTVTAPTPPSQSAVNASEERLSSPENNEYGCKSDNDPGKVIPFGSLELLGI